MRESGRVEDKIINHVVAGRGTPSRARRVGSWLKLKEMNCLRRHKARGLVGKGALGREQQGKEARTTAYVALSLSVYGKV